MATVPNRAIFHTAWTDPVTLESFPFSTNALISVQAQLDRIEAASVAWLDPTFDPASPGAIGSTTPAAGTFTTLAATTITASGIFSAAAGSAAAPSIAATGDTNTGRWHPAADTIAWSVGGVEAFRVNSSGDFIWKNAAASNGMNWDASAASNTGGLGIGIATPGAKVHIVGITGIRFDYAAAQNGALYPSGGDGLDMVLATARILAFRADDSNTGAVSRFQWFNDNAEVMRLDGTGLGIGEAAPDYKLDVNGAIGFTPGASVTPVDIGDVVFEATSNTSFTIRHKGSDGTARSVALTLA